MSDKKTNSESGTEAKPADATESMSTDKKAIPAFERFARSIGGVTGSESRAMDEAKAATADLNNMTPGERSLYLMYVGLENMFTAIKRLALVNLSLILMLCILIGAVVHLAKREPPIAVVYRDDAGEMIELESARSPQVMDVDVVNFAGSRIAFLHTLTPFALEQDLARNREFFEPQAYQNYLQQMEESGDPRIVRQNRISVSAVTTKGPIIINKRNRGGRHVWTLKGEALKTYYDATGDMTPVRLLFEMDVVQVPRSVYRPGIRIQRYIILDSRTGN